MRDYYLQDYWYKLAEDFGDEEGLGIEYFNRLAERLTDHSDDERCNSE